MSLLQETFMICPKKTLEDREQERLLENGQFNFSILTSEKIFRKVR